MVVDRSRVLPGRPSRPCVVTGSIPQPRRDCQGNRRYGQSIRLSRTNAKLATQRLAQACFLSRPHRDSAVKVFNALCCEPLIVGNTRQHITGATNEQLTVSPCTRRRFSRHCTGAPRDPAGASRRGLEPISAGHSLWAHARRLPRSCKARISISSALKSTAQRLRTRRPSCTGIASPPPTRGHRRSRRRRGRAITGQPRICCCTRERLSLSPISHAGRVSYWCLPM
jgi:hypothetical protein